MLTEGIYQNKRKAALTRNIHGCWNPGRSLPAVVLTNTIKLINIVISPTVTKEIHFFYNKGGFYWRVK